MQMPEIAEVEAPHIPAEPEFCFGTLTSMTVLVGRLLRLRT